MAEAEAPEKPKGRWIFGKFWPEGTYTPKGAKGKGKKKPSTNRAKPAASQQPPDEPPAGVDLPGRPSLARDIGQTIEAANDLLLALPWTRNDALTQGEAERLVYGLDEAQKSSPRIRRYVKVGTEGAGIAALIMALAVIIINRLALHGMLPGVAAPTPDELAAWNAKQTAEWEARVARAAAAQMDAQMQAEGTGNRAYYVDPNQSPIVPPIYSNSVG